MKKTTMIAGVLAIALHPSAKAQFKANGISGTNVTGSTLIGTGRTP